MTGKPAKRRHGHTKRKRSNAPRAPRQDSPFVGDLQAKLDACTRQLNEALERENATAEVLRIVSSSPGDLEAVFRNLLGNATRLCVADFGFMFQYDDGAFRLMAQRGADRAYVEYMQREPLHPGPKTLLGRIAKLKAPVQIEDLAGSQGYLDRDPLVTVAVEQGGVRTLFGVPMIRKKELIGTIVLYRTEVRAFTDKQIDLLQNFAAQGVIAIENTRLLNELRQRTRELSEALEQQTATSEVLRVISSSPGELEPVFQAMLENAVRICEAKFGILFRHDGQAFELAAELDTPPEFAEFQSRRGPFQPIPGGHLDRILRTKHVSHTDDNAADAIVGVSASLGGARSAVGVPMIKDDVVIGVIFIYRQEVRPFTDKQIELLQNFAAQAVIAIENTRLLNELRQSLEQQTATSDVLSVIASSPGELQPVFDAMLANATRLCNAKFGTLSLYDGEAFRNVALHNVSPEYADIRLREPFRPHPKAGLAHVARTKQIAHTEDLRTQPPYLEGDPAVVAIADLAGARTIINVPMLKADRLVGTISIFRQEVRPFTDEQIELVSNFAKQAVIAIENTRLLNELRESLQQQTATAEVLGVISSSPGALGPVFEAMLEQIPVEFTYNLRA